MLRSNSGLLIGQLKSRYLNQPNKMLKFQCSVTLRWKYFYRIGSSGVHWTRQWIVLLDLRDTWASSFIWKSYSTWAKKDWCHWAWVFGAFNSVLFTFVKNISVPWSATLKKSQIRTRGLLDEKQEHYFRAMPFSLSSKGLIRVMPGTFSSFSGVGRTRKLSLPIPGSDAW